MQKIIEIVSEILRVPITGETVFEEVEGWDSLKKVQIVMALDEAGISIPLEKIAEVRSIDDLIRFSEQGHA